MEILGLNRRTAAENVLCGKEFNVAKNPKYDGYNVDLVQCSVNFSINKTSGSSIKKQNISNKQLAEELIKKFNRNLMENLIKRKYIDLFQTIFGVQI